MDRSWWRNLIIILVVTVGSVWYLIPTYYSFFVLPRAQRNDLKLLAEKLPSWARFPNHRLNLGLDLQGGIHMVLQVDTKTALQTRVERRGVQIANYLKDKGLGPVSIEANREKLQLTLVAKDAATMDAIQKELKGFDDFSEASRDSTKVVLSLKDSQVARFKEESVDQAMLVIRRRIDKWGVAEVDVRKLGTDSIQISLPGRQDPEQAKELIGTTAQLEFRMVDDASPYFKQL
jgi:preprotein translocase subunit SecD